VTDTSATAGPSVFFLSGSDNTGVDLTPPVSGFGTLEVTTDGGTSAPIAWNVLTPNRGQLIDVAYRATADEVLIADNNTIRRLTAATGSEVGSFDIPGSGFTNALGLQILPAAIPSLVGTAVEAGNLLVTNGTASTDKIFALDPVTGAPVDQHRSREFTGIGAQNRRGLVFPARVFPHELDQVPKLAILLSRLVEANDFLLELLVDAPQPIILLGERTKGDNRLDGRRQAIDPSLYGKLERQHDGDAGGLERNRGIRTGERDRDYGEDG